MRMILTLFASVLLTGTATAQEQRLFNGKDLTGWDGKPGWWTVEDGALTSESTPEKPCRKPNYLVWTGGEPADFELSLDFKLGTTGNSGIQIRSERRPDWDTFGYQADMDADGGLVGYVYHHARGLIAARGEKVTIAADGTKDVEKIGDPEELKAVYNIADWNRYRIVCRGPDITLYVNDELMCQFSDHTPGEARSKGFIALQMHPGPPMKVQFKNILLTPLGTSGPPGPEEALIGVLESDAGVRAKIDACRELRRIGTAAAIPVLAGYLADKQLSHMVRYALQAIPDEAADGALRNALATCTGEQLTGLVSTLGWRRDVRAVDALAELLRDDDASVAQAAATALGRIGSAEAATVLQATAGGADGTMQDALCDALFECAESSSANGKQGAAIAIYDFLRSLPNVPDPVRVGALRGAILVRGKDGLTLLGESIRGHDSVIAQAAAQTALELKDPGVVPGMAAELGNVSADRQVLLAGVLGKLGDPRALPALVDQAKAGQPSTRRAAIRATTEIGGPSTVAVLLGLMNDPDKGVAEAAATCLAGFPGTEVDEAVVHGLSSPDPELRARMVKMVEQRSIREALPILADVMKEEDDALRLSAIESYGALAVATDLPVLLETVRTSTQTDDIAALGKAIAAAYRKGGDPTICVPQMATTLDQALDEAKPTLIKLLRMIGGPEALSVVQQAAADPNPQVQAAATRAIKEWRTDRK